MKPGSLWASAVLLAVLVGGCDDPKPPPGKGEPVIAIQPLSTALPRKPNDLVKPPGSGGPGAEGGKDGADCSCDDCKDPEDTRQMLDGVYHVFNDPAPTASMVGQVLVVDHFEHWVLGTSYKGSELVRVPRKGEVVPLGTFQSTVCQAFPGARYFIVSDQPRVVTPPTSGKRFAPQPVSTTGAFPPDGTFTVRLPGGTADIGEVRLVGDVEHWSIAKTVTLPNPVGFEFRNAGGTASTLAQVEDWAASRANTHNYRVVSSVAGNLNCDLKHL